ncbi:hypothetical protein Tco_0979006 [Tanacetum coccineum]|uniref:Retrotransposon gag domain-containing protein n=1 Tax=Tanacetum coccineum TaxID=301880 RepID=A0ABQ5EPH0_9ASTR
MRTRSSSYSFVEPLMIPTRRNRRHSRKIVEPELRTIEEILMADTRPMSELLQAPAEGVGEEIVVLPLDDTHTHIHWFNKITSTIKLKDVPYEAIKLMLFPFSLSGAARTWLDKEPPNSITTWADLAWDRFKDLLRKCPHHGFSDLHQIYTFYNGLTQSDQDSLNAAAGGNLLNRSTREALTIIESKSKVRNSRIKSIVSNDSSSSPSEISALTEVIKALVLSNNKPQPPPAFVKAVNESCVTCGGPHPYYECTASDGFTNKDVYAAVGSYSQGNHP